MLCALARRSLVAAACDALRRRFLAIDVLHGLQRRRLAPASQPASQADRRRLGRADFEKAALETRLEERLSFDESLRRPVDVELCGRVQFRSRREGEFLGRSFRSDPAHEGARRLEIATSAATE